MLKVHLQCKANGIRLLYRNLLLLSILLVADIVVCGVGVSGGLLEGGRWAMREPMITVL